MGPTETIRAYYGALRDGEPLAPFFAEREDLVKFGITERLEGYEAVAEGLREQTRTTGDWTVESRRLRVSRSGAAAWFSDDVRLAWTDEADADGTRHDYDSRWSGTLLAGNGGEDGDKDGSEVCSGIGRESDRDADRRAEDRRDADRRETNRREADRHEANRSEAHADDDGRWWFVGMHVSAPH